MRSAAEWKQILLETLSSERKAEPDRAGETPLSKLANHLIRFAASGENLAPLSQGLSEIIHSCGEADSEYWGNLCYLIQLANISDPVVSSALYDEFSKGIPRQVRSRATILVTLVAMGRNFTPVELRKEKGVQQQFAPEWIDAWVKSGLFDIVKDEISSLLGAHLITTRDLLTRMASWYQRVGEKLSENVPQWLLQVSSADRKVLERWFKNRGLELKPIAGVGLPQVGQQYRHSDPILQRDAPKYIRDSVARKAKRLNGQAR